MFGSAIGGGVAIAMIITYALKKWRRKRRFKSIMIP